jgi:hypothetical protein
MEKNTHGGTLIFVNNRGTLIYGFYGTSIPYFTIHCTVLYPAVALRWYIKLCTNGYSKTFIPSVTEISGRRAVVH